MLKGQEGLYRLFSCRPKVTMRRQRPSLLQFRLQLRSFGKQMITRPFQMRVPIVLLIFIIISVIYPLPLVGANDYNQDLEGVNLIGDINDEEIDNDWYMILLFSLIFGFVITLFGTGLVYFSLQEDALMRRYRDEGEIVRATVMAATFVRSGDVGGCCSQRKAPPELIAFVEYNRILAKNYTVRVRKQVKVREDDLITPAMIGMSGCMMNIRVNVGRDKTTFPQKGETHFDENGQIYTTTPSDLSGGAPALLGPDEQIHSDPNIGAEQRLLDVLVLPYHVQSAYPKKRIERACSFQSKLSTSILIGFIVVLATFCTALALDAVLGMEDEHRKRIGCYAIGTLVVLIVLEVPLIHFCLHSLFADTLRAEYLERGEFVPIDEGGSSSLSSKGSDMNFQVPISLSIVSLL